LEYLHFQGFSRVEGSSMWPSIARPSREPTRFVQCAGLSSTLIAPSGRPDMADIGMD